MKSIIGLVVLSLTACGSSSSKTPDGKTPDGTSTVDSPNVPATITISGIASERSVSGTTVVAGAVVAAYSSSDPTTVLVMATTDATGAYSLAVPTNGHPIDGFVKATKATYMDTYLYAPAPLIADFASASINMLTPATFSLIQGTLCAANQDAANGTIAIEVVDATNTPVAGAVVATTPAANKYCYNSGGFPNKSITMTDTDGIALAFNVTGSVAVSATKSGSTFASHTVNAVAGAFTTTLVLGQ